MKSTRKETYQETKFRKRLEYAKSISRITQWSVDDILPLLVMVERGLDLAAATVQRPADIMSMSVRGIEPESITQEPL